MFTPAERDAARARLIELARADPRIVSGAEVGSNALRPGDRWSDLDLTFGLAEGVTVEKILTDWTRLLREELDALHLFDLPSGETMYRVYLLPGNLQVDLSFTPGAVAKMGEKFALLFGTAVANRSAVPLDPHDVLGLAVHAALRVRVYVERERWWHAAYFLDELRYQTLAYACLRRGLPGKFGRGLDDLPDDVKDRATGTFVASLERGDLERGLRSGVELLVAESSGEPDAGVLANRLRELL